jgi:hypothetical protein
LQLQFLSSGKGSSPFATSSIMSDEESNSDSEDEDEGDGFHDALEAPANGNEIYVRIFVLGWIAKLSPKA